MESASSMEAISVKFTADIATRIPSGVAPNIITVSVSPARATVPRTPIVAAIPEHRWMTPVIPGARADKDAIHKVAGPVITVRSAGVWIIVIVSVHTSRRTGNIGGTDSDSNPDPYLGLRVGQRDHQNRQQR